MSKKIHSVTLVFVCLLSFLVAGLLFSVAAAKVSADELARLEQDRANIVSLIKDGNYPHAQALTQKLLADFHQNPALPETLYDIAENFRWTHISDRDKDKYGQAQSVYRQIIANYPDNPFAHKAALGIAKTKVLYFIVAQDFNSARYALNEMAAAFQNDPDLPFELYWIGRGYGYWEKHEEEENAYQQIIQNHPSDPYADRARIAFAKANIQSLIMSKDYGAAGEALNEMVEDFPEHPDLPESLYWIAERYSWEGLFDDSNSLFQQIIQNYPDSPFSDKARTGLSKVNALSLVLSQDCDHAGEALEKIINDFNDNPILLKDVLKRVLETRYKQACSRQQKQGSNEQVKEEFRYAKSIAEMIEKLFPDSAADLPEAHLYMAYCDYQLGENAQAAEHCQKIISDWLDYEYVHYAQLLIAGSYEKLADSGVISTSEADYQIERALLSVIEKETIIDGESIARALLELARWYAKIGEKDLAANFYEEFLMRMDGTNSPDAPAVKAKLEKLR